MEVNLSNIWRAIDTKLFESIGKIINATTDAEFQSTSEEKNRIALEDLEKLNTISSSDIDFDDLGSSSSMFIEKGYLKFLVGLLEKIIAKKKFSSLVVKSFTGKISEWFEILPKLSLVLSLYALEILFQFTEFTSSQTVRSSC